jgi:hypoxanthine phosphoribosyltransferase
MATTIRTRHDWRPKPQTQACVRPRSGKSFHVVAKLKPSKPPIHWRNEIESVLISPAALKRRILELSDQIESDYADKELVIVSLLSGTVLFLADLIRNINLPLRLDFMGVSSYGAGTVSRELVFTKDLRIDVRKRHVLLVDDILDTGRTFQAVLAKLKKLRPASIRTCVLLNKAARREVRIDADYVGFEIPDLFVVGYGLDFAERYRNLPFVGVLHPKLYRAAAE